MMTAKNDFICQIFKYNKVFLDTSTCLYVVYGNGCNNKTPTWG